MGRPSLRRAAPPLAVAVGALATWEILASVTGVPATVLSRPSAVAAAMSRTAGPLLSHAGWTLTTTLIGFAIGVGAGLLLGLALGLCSTCRSALQPLLLAFDGLPKAAAVPVLVIWLGAGLLPAVVTAALLAFHPVAVNVAGGLGKLEAELWWILAALGASRRDVFVKVAAPRGLLALAASLKVAASSAFVGSVISETVAGNAGLGHLTAAAASRLDAALAFAGLLVLTALGTALHLVGDAVERRVSARAYGDS